MQEEKLANFVSLIRNQFCEEDRAIIDAATDLRSLKEWSSLQTMIIVSEIDKEYNVVLGFEDIRNSANIGQLFHVVQSKLS
jgi:acyl carrier protein